MKNKLFILILIIFWEVLPAQTIHNVLRNGVITTDTISVDDIWGFQDSLNVKMTWSNLKGIPGGFKAANIEQRAITTTTQASTSTIAVNITGLGLPVIANKKYEFEAWIPYSTVGKTTGIGLAHTPITGNCWHETSANSTTTATMTRRFYNSSALFIATSSAATTGNVAYMQGRIEPTANTTFQLQFATEVAGSAITLQPGGILIVKEVF